jgi:hypothetical protein
LKPELQSKLITDITVLRITYPGTTAGSTIEGSDSRRESISEISTGFRHIEWEDNAGATKQEVPLTHELFDLMDMPVPSGMLAGEFAYHGLAPAVLNEVHNARELIDGISTEIKRC